MNSGLPALLGLALVVLTTPPACAAQSQRIDADSGVATWETQAHGVTLQLTQLTPDTVRAFFLKRGFSSAAADRFAGACVYMTVLRNDAAPGELGFRLSDWTLQSSGTSRPLPSVDAWMAEWQAAGLSEAAQIAFRWAHFPPEQEYARGEWNQGMLATGLPAGSRFDLTARWQVGGQIYEGKLEHVLCAH